jgi:non-ribosomal peptide synthetase component F
MLQFASFSFDASIWEIFSTLCYGGTLVLTPEDSVLLSDRLAEFIVNNNISRALLTPVVARTIVPKNLDTMKDLFVGGDAFHQSIIEDWNEKYDLWNAYGPTEATVCVTVHKFRKEDQVVLGKALPKNKLSIPDGELVIEGDQVAIGDT